MRKRANAIPTPAPASQVLFAYAVFLCSGFNTTLLSVLAPQFAGRLSDATLGGIFAAQYTGQLLGPLLFFRRPMVGILGGLFLSSFASFYLFVSGDLNRPILALYGLGLGAVMAGTNVFVGTISREAERKPRIERLNFFWPLSALCTPLLLQHIHLSLPLHAFALVTANSLLTILFAGPLCLNYGLFRLRSDAETTDIRRHTALLMLLCILAAFACGAESALFSWAPTFASRHAVHSYDLELAVGAFWSGLLSGRLSASWLFAHTHGRRITVIAALVCGFAIGVLAIAHAELMMVCALFLAGLSIASIYPSIISDGLPLRGSQWIFVSAGVGSAALPWLMGKVSAAGGSLRWGQSVPAAACVALGSLYAYAQKHLHAPLDGANVKPGD